MRRLMIALIVVMTMLFTVGIAAAATELVTNGGFEPNLSGWDNVFGGLPESGIVHSGNGSVVVSTDGTLAGVVEQCAVFSIPSNGYVSLAAWVYLNGGDASVEAYSYTNNQCDPVDGESQFFGQTADTLSSGWQLLDTPTGSSAPQLIDGAESVRIRLIVTGAADAGAYFDDVSASPYGTLAITLRDFSAQAQSPTLWLPAALLIVLSGALVVSRRRQA